MAVLGPGSDPAVVEAAVALRQVDDGARTACDVEHVGRQALRGAGVPAAQLAAVLLPVCAEAVLQPGQHAQRLPAAAPAAGPDPPVAQRAVPVQGRDGAQRASSVTAGLAVAVRPLAAHVALRHADVSVDVHVQVYCSA